MTRVGGDRMLVLATTKHRTHGLDNGPPYPGVSGRPNDVGWGVESPVSDPVTPGPVPATPTDFTASADTGTAWSRVASGTGRASRFASLEGPLQISSSRSTDGDLCGRGRLWPNTE